MSNLPIKAKLEELRSEAYVKEMNEVLSDEEKGVLRTHLEYGGLPISLETSTKFFELFLTNTNCHDIWKLNRSFPFGAILDARIKYKWDKEKDDYAIRLQSQIKNKIIQAQLETADLMSDMLLATKKRSGAKLKRYLQSGNEEDLDGSLTIESIAGMQRILEGLMKITGQDKTTVNKNITETRSSVDVKVVGGEPMTGNADMKTLPPEDAAAVLQIIANANRKANDSSNK